MGKFKIYKTGDDKYFVQRKFLGIFDTTPYPFFDSFMGWGYYESVEYAESKIRQYLEEQRAQKLTKKTSFVKVFDR